MMGCLRLTNLSVGVSILMLGLMASLCDAQTINLEEAASIWLFEEGKGNTTKDLTANGNHAEFNGNPQWTKGRFGQGLKFDGGSDYLSVKDSDSLDVEGEALTLMAWVKADGWPSGWNHIIRKTPEDPRIYILGVHSSALPFMFLKTVAQQYDDIQGKTKLPTKKWIHLAMTYNGKVIIIYVNGEPDATEPAKGKIEASDGELRIGRGAPAGYLAGTLDEVAVFRVALSQNQIKSVMEVGFEVSLSVDSEARLASTWANIKASLNIH